MDLRGFLLLAETVPPIELQRPKGTALINLAVAGLIVTALYFAREILVPVALAVLFSFVLAPAVIRLQSWRVPRRLSVLVAVFVGFSIIFSLGGLMVSQANRLAEELPGYQQTLREKIQNLRGVAASGSGTLERASKVLRELDSELHNPARGQIIDGLRRQPNDKPIPVEIRQPDPVTTEVTTLPFRIEDSPVAWYSLPLRERVAMKFRSAGFCCGSRQATAARAAPHWS